MFNKKYLMLSIFLLPELFPYLSLSSFIHSP
mgnify:CR=1 FL=1